ncbi:MAG: flagellar hook-basal body complex protein, partial [bacterium]|nr:flagellar hook-basal body complex protein [bacterium]
GLGDVGGASNVTGVNFSVAVDGGAAQAITGLSVNSTIGDLINAINAQVPGAIASLNGTQLQIERRAYGDTASHYLQLTDTTGGTPPNNLCTALFGATTRTAGGTDSTLVAVDDFIPTGATTPSYTGRQLSFTRNSDGLVTGIEGIGGGGVTVSSAAGIAAGSANIATADTTHSTSIVVYDTLGVGHNLNMTFAKTGNANEWRWTATLPGESAAVMNGNTGKISFNSDGSLANFTFDGNASNLTIQLPNGAESLTIALDAGLAGSLSGITQTSSAFSTQATSQNGYASGKLDGLSVDDSGTVYGAFTNGLTRALAQVELATFTNAQGLSRASGNLFETTVNSGDPKLSTANGTSNRVYSGYLELSNVDLAKEFTSLIIGQRGYSANSRTIQTADQLLMETLQIKR